MQTDIPWDIKIKYHYKALIGTSTYVAWRANLSRLDWAEEDQKYHRESRHTYNALVNEISNMPEIEYRKLPEELQVSYADKRPPITKISNYDIQSPSSKIAVKIQPNTNNRAVLEVKNLGDAAILTAKAKIISGEIRQGIFTMCWEPQPVTKYHIDKGEVATILVAEILPIKSNVSNNLVGISLFRFNGTQKEPVAVSSTDLIETHFYSEMYPNSPSMFDKWPVDEDKCVIEVTITANPDLEKPIKQRYSLIVKYMKRTGITSIPQLVFASIR